MTDVVCKVTVHKRGGAKNLPYILRGEAAKDPSGQTIEGPQRDEAPEFVRQGRHHELAAGPTRQLELSFGVDLPLQEDEALTLDDDPVFTWNVPEFVTGDLYGIEWWEASAGEKKAGPGEGRLGGEQIGAGTQKGREFTLEEKRLNAEIYFGLRADFEEGKGGVSHFRVMITINAAVSNRQFKRLIMPFLAEVFRLNGALVALHRNTGEGKTHAHVHADSRQSDGRRLDLGQRYFRLDEVWARTCAEHFRDPGIYDRHMKKKEETREWKERCRAAKERQEPPPPKPDREADHHGTRYARPFDDRWVGRQIAIESLAKKRLEYLTVTKAPKRQTREARKEVEKQSELVRRALEKREDGKMGAKDYVPSAVVTAKEAEKIGQYERGIKAARTREMAGHIQKVTDDYLKSLNEKELTLAAVSPEAGEAHAGRSLGLRLGVLKDHNVGLDRTEWSEGALKSGALEALRESANESLTTSKARPVEPAETRTPRLRNAPPARPAAEPQRERTLDARQIRARMIFAQANELIEKHLLEKVIDRCGLSSLRKGDGRFENVLFDLKGIFFEHCVRNGSSLEELRLTERSLTGTLEKYLLGFGEGYVAPPFAGGGRVREVELEEKRLRAYAPLGLAHGPSHTRELADLIARVQQSHINTPAPKGPPPSELEAARLHGRSLLAALRLDAAEAEAERYKHYSLFEEKIKVPDNYGEPVIWSLAQGKFFNATPRNSLRDRYWRSAPQVSEAVSEAERRVGEGLRIREVAAGAARYDFDRASGGLAVAAEARSSHGLNMPGPGLTGEQSLEVEELIFKTWNTDALEKLSGDEESRGLREAAGRAGARLTLALVHAGEDRERQRTGDRKVVEKMRGLPEGSPLRAELQAYLDYRREESKRVERFVLAAGQIADRLQLKCEVELGGRAHVLFRSKEAELVKEKLPCVEQRERERLTKEINSNSVVRSDEGLTESVRFSDMSRSDYGKYRGCDLSREFENDRVLTRG